MDLVKVNEIFGYAVSVTFIPSLRKDDNHLVSLDFEMMKDNTLFNIELPKIAYSYLCANEAINDVLCIDIKRDGAILKINSQEGNGLVVVPGLKYSDRLVGQIENHNDKGIKYELVISGLINGIPGIFRTTAESPKILFTTCKITLVNTPI
jgi:hypothetical protein